MGDDGDACSMYCIKTPLEVWVSFGFMAVHNVQYASDNTVRISHYVSHCLLKRDFLSVYSVLLLAQDAHCLAHTEPAS